jgi:membrane protein DedA with SNARE-associated domain
VTRFLESYGLWFLFAIIGLESAGAWLPGETALVAAAVAASQGSFDIVEVIVVAAAAAIVGDNIGYWLGREGGRRLLYRWGWLGRLSDRVLPPAERFFERHGGKTVFFGRFFGGLRVTAAWIAGITRMPWWKFFFWNASGGIVWAVGVGLIAFYLGKAVAEGIGRYGVYGAVGVAILALLVLGAIHLWKRWLMRSPREESA